MPYLKIGEPTEMDGSTKTTIMLEGKQPGYAHVKYWGTYEGEDPTNADLLKFMDDGTCEGPVRHFGGRAISAFGGKFSCIVHID